MQSSGDTRLEANSGDELVNSCECDIDLPVGERQPEDNDAHELPGVLVNLVGDVSSMHTQNKRAQAMVQAVHLKVLPSSY